MRGVGLVVVGGLLVLLIFSLLSSDTMTMRYGGARFSLERTPSALFPVIVKAFGIYALVLGALVIAAMVFFSHRIIGPLYRIKKHVRSMAEGDLAEELRLRKHDDPEMKELADRLNALTRDLNRRLAQLKAHAGEIRALADEVGPKSGKHAPDEVGKHLKDIAAAAKKLHEAAGYFRTKNENKAHH
jgi:methyl-accepting chemotaxis protein